MVLSITFGTAKLGLPSYGIGSNQHATEAIELLKGAYASGIRDLDTSTRYGNAEDLIGCYHSKGHPKFSVSTKVDGLTGDNADFILKSVQESLVRADVSSFHTVYLHQNDLSIISNLSYLRKLNDLKSMGLTKFVGVSLYSREECQFAVGCNEIDVIQIPVSILDTRFHREFVESKQSGKIFVARSVFLQGAILNQERAPSTLRSNEGFQKAMKLINKAADDSGLSILELAMAFIRKITGLKEAIVGTANLQHLRAMILAKEFPSKYFDEIYSLAASDESWKNPRNWK